jgi:phage regulator Rha-like protein
MEQLVHIRKNDIFTDSLVISRYTENEHRAVKQLIRTHEKRLTKYGALKFSPLHNNIDISNVEMVRQETRGRKEEIFELNEMQATLLIALMKNTEPVLNFKQNLIEEFFRMRGFLLEKQTAEWQQSRKIGKKQRLQETDIILTKLIPLAESQGSKHSDKFYMIYSKLVNSTLGVQAGQRENLPYEYIEAIRIMENAIENIISLEVDKGTHYKEIYQIVKVKLGILRDLAFLPTLQMITG